MSEHIDLSAYIDRALPPAEMTAAEAHLKTCTACRTELKDLQGAITWMKKSSQPKTPAGLENRLLAKLRSQGKPGRQWSWGLSGGLVGAAIVALLMINIGHRRRENLFYDKQDRFEEHQNKPESYSVDRAEENFAMYEKKSRARSDRAKAQGKSIVVPAAAPVRRAANEPAGNIATYSAGAPAAKKAEAEQLADLRTLDADAGAGSKDDSEAVIIRRRSVPVWSGPTCAIKTFSTRVIHNKADWTALWREALPMERAPSVDFSSFMVVAVFSGQGPYSDVAIFPPQEENGKLVVRFRRKKSGVSARPYSMLAVPATSAAVMFREAD